MRVGAGLKESNAAIFVGRYSLSRKAGSVVLVAGSTWRNTPPRGLDALEAVDLLEQLRDPLLSLPACTRVFCFSTREADCVALP